MRFRIAAIVGAVCAVAAVPGVAAAADGAAGATVRTVTSPEWETVPDGDAFAAHYPPAAAEAGLGGRAVVDCAVAASGRLQDCRVMSEEPAGHGFGTAALAVAWSFRMKPRMVDGEPVDGAHVHVPIRFAVSGSGSASRSAAATSGKNSEAAVVDALRAVGVYFLVILAITLAFQILLFIWPMSRVFRRAGAKPGLAWLFLVPGLNLCVPWIAAEEAEEKARSERLGV